jgi:C-terminal processing protease CtpA/Prc
MNYGDVLLGIDGVDIEGKHLQDIKYIILYKTNTTVQLTFLNKHWFNNQIRKSVKVRDNTQKID